MPIKPIQILEKVNKDFPQLLWQLEQYSEDMMTASSTIGEGEFKIRIVYYECPIEQWKKRKREYEFNIKKYSGSGDVYETFEEMNGERTSYSLYSKAYSYFFEGEDSRLPLPNKKKKPPLITKEDVEKEVKRYAEFVKEEMKRFSSNPVPEL